MDVTVYVTAIHATCREPSRNCAAGSRPVPKAASTKPTCSMRRVPKRAPKAPAGRLKTAYATKPKPFTRPTTVGP